MFCRCLRCAHAMWGLLFAIAFNFQRSVFMFEILSIVMQRYVTYITLLRALSGRRCADLLGMGADVFVKPQAVVLIVLRN